MFSSQRLLAALSASLKHLFASFLVALIGAALVFGLWYPPPYSELLGGKGLFYLLMSVDVVCGPLLTFVVYSPHKARPELRRDIGFVVILQIVAFVYGMNVAIQARPVFLAFEGDSFRVVTALDIDMSGLLAAPQELRVLSLFGPKIIGVRLSNPSDADYPESIRLSVEGLHPSFRPSRWLPYEHQKMAVVQNSRALSALIDSKPMYKDLIEQSVNALNKKIDQLGYLPLVSSKSVDWVAVVDLTNAYPVGFLPIDGW